MSVKAHKASFLIRKYLRSQQSYKDKINSVDYAILTICGDLLDINNSSSDRSATLRAANIAKLVRVTREHVTRRLKFYSDKKILYKLTNYRGRPNRYCLDERLSTCDVRSLVMSKNDGVTLQVI